MQTLFTVNSPFRNNSEIHIVDSPFKCLGKERSQALECWTFFVFVLNQIFF